MPTSSFDPNLHRDVEASHTLANNVYAELFGKIGYLGCLERLRSSHYQSGDMVLAKKVIKKVEAWAERVHRGEKLISLEWTRAESAESKECFDLVGQFKLDLLDLADRCERALQAADLSSSSDRCALLTAASVRIVYCRQSLYSGGASFYHTIGDSQREQQCALSLGVAQASVSTIDKVAEVLGGSQRPPDIFYVQFREHVQLTPGTLRARVHDLNQIHAMIQKSFSYPHTEIPPQEGAAWHNAGFNPVMAGYWHAYRIPPNEASNWCDAGVFDAATAATFRLYRFDPQSANPWLAHQFPAPLARRWADAGYDAQSAAQEASRGAAPPSAGTDNQGPISL